MTDAAPEDNPTDQALTPLRERIDAIDRQLVELVSRGITDTDAESVVWRKKHGWKDEQILHDFPPKS
jgi:hypothetical protein